MSDAVTPEPAQEQVTCRDCGVTITPVDLPDVQGWVDGRGFMDTFDHEHRP